MSANFRLGIVLRLREVAEDAARVDVGRALAGHRAALDAMTELDRRREVERSRLAALQVATDAPPAGEIAESIVAFEHAERTLAAGSDELERSARELMTARTRLADASRRRQVVERLRDRVRAAARRDADRRLDAEASEIAGTRHA